MKYLFFLTSLLLFSCAQNNEQEKEDHFEIPPEKYIPLDHVDTVISGVVDESKAGAILFCEGHAVFLDNFDGSGFSGKELKVYGKISSELQEAEDLGYSDKDYAQGIPDVSYRIAVDSFTVFVNF